MGSIIIGIVVLTKLKDGFENEALMIETVVDRKLLISRVISLYLAELWGNH
jgi:hypothetical protein